MYNVSNELKNKLNSNSVTTTARLTFSNPQLVIDGNNLVSLKLKDCCYNEGRIIGTNIAKDIEVTIKNNNYDLQDKEFYLEIGILLDSGKYEYIPYGNFIIDTVEDTKSNNEYKITAMDYMIKLNENFVEFDAKEYPMTMKQFLQKFAKQYGIELVVQTLPNENLQIPTIPYFENMSGRTVLKNIAEVFGRFAKFNRENKLEFVLSKTVNEQISRNNMNSNLEIDKQYGEVNVVSILLSDDVIGENVTLRDEESIALYGENIIKIVGNEFLNTQDMRSAAIQAIFNELKGFKYIPTSFTYMAKPYLDCGDTILVQDMETDEYHESIVLNHSIEIAALRQSKMENLALTKVQVQQQYIPELEKRMGRTEFNVNKVDKKITLVVEEQTTQSNRITNVENKTNTVASNLNTFINETYSNDISNLQDQIDGAIQFWNGELIPTLSNYPANEWTTEEQRNNHRADIYTVIQDIDGEMKQGKSYRFDKVGTTWQWVELTDNELSAVQALANSKAKVYVTTPTVPYNVGDLWLKDKELYECIKSKDASGSYSASDWSKATKYTDDTKANEVDKKLTTTNEKVATIEINLDSVTTRVSATESGIKDVEQAIDTEDRFIKQTEVQIDSVDNILDDVEMYGDLKQETRSGKNKLEFVDGTYTDKNVTAVVEDGVITLNGNSSSTSFLYINRNFNYIFKANQKYTISLNNSNIINSSEARFRLADLNGDKVIKDIYLNSINKKETFYFTEDTLVTIIQIRTGTSITYNNFIIKPQLEIGETATDWEQYGVSPSPDYPSEIQVVGDNVNLFDKDNAEFIIGYFDSTTGEIVNTGNSTITTTYTEIEPNQDFILNCQGLVRVVFYDYNKNIVKITNSTSPLVFNENASYIRMQILTENLNSNKIKLVKGTVENGYIDYEVVSKNLINSVTTHKFTYSTGVITNGDERYLGANKKTKIKPNTQYTITFFDYPDITSANELFISYYDFYDKFIKRVHLGSLRTFITPSNAYYIFAYLYNSDAVFTKVGGKIQLEKGTVATEYVEHQSQSTTIELPQGEFMAKIGDYEDYIDNKGILHKYIGKTVIDGSETITIKNSGNDNWFYEIQCNIPPSKQKNQVCTHYNFAEVYNANTFNGIIVINSGKQIRVRYGTEDTVDNFKTWLKEQYANGTPVEVYYELAEPYNVELTAESRKKYLNLPTIEGINNISILASTSGTYKRNTEMNKVYAKQNYVDEKFAEQVITNDNITSRVSATETTISNQSSDISSLNESIGSVNSDINNLQSNVETVKTQYTELKETVESFNFDVVTQIQQQLEDGTVTSNQVKTTSVTIDQDGIKVAKSGSEMQSLFDNEGLYVNKGAIDKTETKNNTLTVDKDGVVTENLYVRTYLTAGYHRTEGFIEDGEKRTGVFYQGGVNE